MAKRVPLPAYTPTTPAKLKSLLKQAKANDDRDAAYVALMKYAHSNGALGDITHDLYAWLHEIKE